MTTPIKVEIELDIDKHLHSEYRQVGEEDFAPVPSTLETLVLNLAAQKLLTQTGILSGADRDYTTKRLSLVQELRDRVNTIRDEEIRVQVKPIIAEALAGQIRKTNAYGEPTGQTTTLREIIGKEAERILARKDGDSYGHKGTIEALIREQVQTAFVKEMKAEMDKARQEMVAAVREQGSKILAETIQKMAGSL